jgi:hypothetical protein
MSENNNEKTKNNIKSLLLVIAMMAMVGGLFAYEMIFNK